MSCTSQREVVAQIDLFSFDRVAGNTTLRPRWETAVAFNRPAVERADAATRARYARQVDIDQWELDYITLPFDLLPINDGYYSGIRVQIRFDHPDVIAKYLAPDERNEKDVPFPGVARANGLGGSSFGWQFAPTQEKKELFPRSHAVLALLQRPRDSAEYDLALDVEAEIVRRGLVISRREARAQEPCRYRLSFDTGTFVRLPT